MPRFSIQPIQPGVPTAEIVATDPHQVLGIVGRLACEEADVLKDGRYSYSLRLDGNGIWCIFHRQSASIPADIPAFG